MKVLPEFLLINKGPVEARGMAATLWSDFVNYVKSPLIPAGCQSESHSVFVCQKSHCATERREDKTPPSGGRMETEPRQEEEGKIQPGWG